MTVLVKKRVEGVELPYAIVLRLRAETRRLQAETRRLQGENDRCREEIAHLLRALHEDKQTNNNNIIII
jgi:hypothetical protein